MHDAVRPSGFSRTGGATIDVIAPDATCRTVGTFQDQGSGPPITCTKVENSFALPDPLRNLAAPAMPGLAAGDGAGRPHQDIAGLLSGRDGREGADADPDADLRCRRERQRRIADLSWILYPGSVPRRPEGRRTARPPTSCPGIYWIGGGGLDVGGGGASIVTIGVATDATATPATNPCATATTTAALCGGVMFYNSKTASAAGGPVILNANAARMKLASLDRPERRPERDLQRHRLLPGSHRRDADHPERIVLVHPDRRDRLRARPRRSSCSGMAAP